MFPLPLREGARGRVKNTSPTLTLPRNRGGDKIQFFPRNGGGDKDFNSPSLIGRG